jgi:FtsP/CotA-like multicopper oxidase with cupredoxin domain
MLAYNGSVPSPTLQVEQGRDHRAHPEDGDIATTVHWHGLRPEHRYDGVRHETQQPIPVGGCYSCQVQFPDAGFHWYHPHIRGGPRLGDGPQWNPSSWSLRMPRIGRTSTAS